MTAVDNQGNTVTNISENSDILKILQQYIDKISNPPNSDVVEFIKFSISFLDAISLAILQNETSPSKINESVMSEVKSWVDGEALRDDLTLLTVKK